MRRFYAPDIAAQPELKGNEAKHISRVLRMQPGDMLVLFDGSGYDYTAEITGIGEGSVFLHVREKAFSQNEPRVRVTVYQAVIKSDHFEYAVQKCTELGAYRFVPFISEHCVKQPKSEANFLERASRVALEAAKQCGRSFVPRVQGIAPLSGLPAMIRNEFTVLAYENEQRRTIKQVLESFTGDALSVIIGPEGGFSEEEAATLAEAGAHPASLGKLILRAETAGVAALAMARYAVEL